MKTPAQIEQILTRGFLGREEPPTEFLAKNAQAKFSETRARVAGFTSKGSLFSEEISKLRKSEQKTIGLAFLPAAHSEIGNVCAFAGDCAPTCVAFSGNGSFNSTHLARLARLTFALESPLWFANLLWEELRYHTQDNTYSVAVRLNTYSDIRWEKVAPNLFTYFDRSNFYDYTKHPMRSRPVSSLPANYSLTYSVSEKTTAKEIDAAREASRNVAVVVGIRSGKTANGWRPIPETWAGMPTIDGDQRDDRHNDPTGHAVILRRKHTLKESSGLIVNAAAIASRAAAREVQS